MPGLKAGMLAGGDDHAIVLQKGGRHFGFRVVHQARSKQTPLLSVPVVVFGSRRVCLLIQIMLGRARDTNVPSRSKPVRFTAVALDGLVGT